MSNLVIFGGTFDPIHNGHLRIAEAAAKKLDASLIFVPSKSPRWKTPEEIVDQRLDMLRIALKNVSFKAEISEFELKSNDETNYSIDTVKYFKKLYPYDKLYFLIGADQVNKFDQWKDANELSKLVTVVYSSRPYNDINTDIVNKYGMVDLQFEESGEVSSSAIREMKSIDLPFDVLKYIEDNQLYFVKKLAGYLLPKRLSHSISVANLSLEVASVNNLKPLDKFFFAALFHDLGKTYSEKDESILSIMRENYSEWMDLPLFSYHQFVGEHLARHDFGIVDDEILDAIKFHCTGKANMSQLGMVIYACDKIEPTRDFDSTWLINSCMENWKKGFLTTLEDNRKYLLEHNKDIMNRLTAECFKMYLK